MTLRLIKVRLLYFSLLFLFLTKISSCSEGVDSKNITQKKQKLVNQGLSVDTNQILNLINLNEFLIREQSNGIIRDSVLQKLAELKDSINYDSIVLSEQKGLPTFK